MAGILSAACAHGGRSLLTPDPTDRQAFIYFCCHDDDTVVMRTRLAHQNCPRTYGLGRGSRGTVDYLVKSTTVDYQVSFSSSLVYAAALLLLLCLGLSV